MQRVQKERIRLAYLEAMGLTQWIPRDARTAGQAEAVGSGSSPVEAVKPATDSLRRDQPAATPDRSITGSAARPSANIESAPATATIAWQVEGKPQAWLWLLDEKAETDQALLGKIQAACDVSAPGYIARAGGTVPPTQVLQAVEVIVVFGETAWQASGLADLRKNLTSKIIQTVSFERLREDSAAKSRLWKQLQANLAR